MSRRFFVNLLAAVAGFFLLFPISASAYVGPTDATAACLLYIAPITPPATKARWSCALGSNGTVGVANSGYELLLLDGQEYYRYTWTPNACSGVATTSTTVEGFQCWTNGNVGGTCTSTPFWYPAHVSKNGCDINVDSVPFSCYAYPNNLTKEFCSYHGVYTGAESIVAQPNNTPSAACPAGMVYGTIGTQGTCLPGGTNSGAGPPPAAPPTEASNATANAATAAAAAAASSAASSAASTAAAASSTAATAASSAQSASNTAASSMSAANATAATAAANASTAAATAVSAANAAAASGTAADAAAAVAATAAAVQAQSVATNAASAAAAVASAAASAAATASAANQAANTAAAAAAAAQSAYAQQTANAAVAAQAAAANSAAAAAAANAALGANLNAANTAAATAAVQAAAASAATAATAAATARTAQKAATDAAAVAAGTAGSAAATAAAAQLAATAATNAKLQALIDKPAATCGGPGQPDCNPFVGPGDGVMPSHTGSWYTSKYPGGLHGVWDSRKAALFETPLGAALANMVVPVGAGSEPSWTFTLWGIAGTYTLAMPSWLWGVVRAILLLSAAFACRRIIFGG